MKMSRRRKVKVEDAVWFTIGLISEPEPEVIVQRANCVVSFKRQMPLCGCL